MVSSVTPWLALKEDEDHFEISGARFVCGTWPGEPGESKPVLFREHNLLTERDGALRALDPHDRNRATEQRKLKPNHLFSHTYEKM